MNEQISNIFEFKIFTEKIVSLILNELFFDYCCIGFFDNKNNKIKISEAVNVPSEIIFKFQFESENLMKKYFKEFFEYKIISATELLEKSNQAEIDETSILFMPIKNNNTTLGYIFVSNKNKKEYNQFDINFILNYANMIGIVFAKSNIDIETNTFNFYDPLTHLYNQDYFFEALNNEIENARLNNSEFSLIMCELENYMEYSEKYGNIVMNKLMIQISRILNSNMRKIDICTVFYGNIFAIISPDVSNAEALNKIRIVKKIIESEQFVIDGVNITDIKIRFGLKTFNGTENIKSNILIREAVKSIGKI